MIIIEQNTTTELQFVLSDYFNSDTLMNIIAAEITFGQGKDGIRKLWYNYNKTSSSAQYNKTTQILSTAILPQDSNSWKYQIPIQIRIKDKNNKIHTSPIIYGYIKTVLSTEDF